MNIYSELHDGEVTKCFYLRTVVKYNFEVPLFYWSILIFHHSMLPLRILDADIAPLFHYIYLITLVTLQIAGCIRCTFLKAFVVSAIPPPPQKKNQY